MKTIRQALIDDIAYPLGTGAIDNKLIKRGLSGDNEYTQEIANGASYKGALADCLMALIEAPNFNEADKSISLGDKSLILKKANSLYRQIGEEEQAEDKPKVQRIRWQLLRSRKTR